MRELVDARVIGLLWVCTMALNPGYDGTKSGMQTIQGQVARRDGSVRVSSQPKRN